MAAGLGFIEFATGDILTAAAANGYLASQSVMVFADSAARTSAIASPQEGMMSYLKDTNSVEYYSGSAWVAVGGSSSSAFTGAGIKKSAVQSISNNTFTAITFNLEDFDTNTYHDNSTNNSRITIPTGKGGYYALSGVVSFAANGTGARGITLNKNGAEINYLIFQAPNVSGQPLMVPISYVISAAANDYLELFAYQASGGSLDIKTETNWQVQYLGA
jgi:hypothetical protein